MSWWRMWRKWLERGSELSIITSVATSGVSTTSASVVYQPIPSSMNANSSSGSTRSGWGRKPERASSVVQRLGVVLDHRALRGELQLHGGGVEALEEAEVEERNAPVGEQHEVARMGVAGELAVAVQAAEEEAKHDLPDAVALLLRVALELLEAHALHELAHEHALARELGDHVGDLDEGVTVEDPRQRALVLGLELVVELLADPLADLRRDRAHVELGGHPLEQTHDHVEVLQVRPHRRRDPGILDLHRDLAPVLAQPCAVHLADRGRRDAAVSSKASNTVRIRSSRSSSITLRICLKETVGAASRSFASSCWNSSRYSSGTSPTSRKDITWPSFIAAPFIVPSTDTICFAVSTCRRASASWPACSPRVTLAARVPNCLTVSVAASFPTVAVRRTLDVGTFFSRATPPC